MYCKIFNISAAQPGLRAVTNILLWSFIKIWSAASGRLCVTDGGMERWTSADPQSHCGGQQWYQRLINQIIWQMVWRNYFPHRMLLDEPPASWWNWASALDWSPFILSNKRGKVWGGKRASISRELEERKKRRMMEKYCSFPLDVIWSQPGYIALWNIAGAQN